MHCIPGKEMALGSTMVRKIRELRQCITFKNVLGDVNLESCHSCGLYYFGSNIIVVVIMLWPIGIYFIFTVFINKTFG